MSAADRQLEHIDKCPGCGAWRWDALCRGACRSRLLAVAADNEPQDFLFRPTPAAPQTGNLAG